MGYPAGLDSALMVALQKGNAGMGIHLEDNVRALVDHPDIVVLVDAHGVRVRLATFR